MFGILFLQNAYSNLEFFLVFPLRPLQIHEIFYVT